MALRRSRERGSGLPGDRLSRGSGLSKNRDHDEAPARYAIRRRKASDAVLSDIYRVLFVYDPGFGVNAPD